YEPYYHAVVQLDTSGIVMQGMDFHHPLTRRRRYGSTAIGSPARAEPSAGPACRTHMTLRILAALVLCSTTAFAQAPRESDRRPEAAAPIQRSQCDLLAGVERERCIAEEKSMREQL